MKPSDELREAKSKDKNYGYTPHQGERQRARIRKRLIQGKMNPNEHGVIEARESLIDKWRQGKPNLD